MKIQVFLLIASLLLLAAFVREGGLAGGVWREGFGGTLPWRDLARHYQRETEEGNPTERFVSRG